MGDFFFGYLLGKRRQRKRDERARGRETSGALGVFLLICLIVLAYRHWVISALVLAALVAIVVPIRRRNLARRR